MPAPPRRPLRPPRCLSPRRRSCAPLQCVPHDQPSLPCRACVFLSTVIRMVGLCLFAASRAHWTPAWRLSSPSLPPSVPSFAEPASPLGWHLRSGVHGCTSAPSAVPSFWMPNGSRGAPVLHLWFFLHSPRGHPRKPRVLLLPEWSNGIHLTSTANGEYLLSNRSFRFTSNSCWLTVFGKGQTPPCRFVEDTWILPKSVIHFLSTDLHRLWFGPTEKPHPPPGTIRHRCLLS